MRENTRLDTLEPLTEITVVQDNNAYELPNNNLIPAHSPFGNQFGVGIKTNELGPRRERAQRFAPLQQPAENQHKGKERQKRGFKSNT